MNPAFTIGQQVGTNFGKAFKDVQDTSMLDKILSESLQSNDPNLLQNNIGQILKSVSPERQPQAIKFLESRLANLANQRKEAEERKIAEDVGYTYGAPVGVQTQEVKEKYRQKELSRWGQGEQPQTVSQQPNLAQQQIQPEQAFIPGMQLPQQKKEQNVLTPEMQQQNKQERLKNPSLWTEDELIKAQSSPLVEIRDMAKAEQNRRQERSKEVARSYSGINEKFINGTYDKYESAQRKDAILDRMTQLEETGELSDSGIINLLGQMGFKEEWLKNPFNEEYNKLGLDLLGGGTLQQDYGSRILASEFKVSQQRIPSLSQTPEGRKQIKENQRAMLLPSKLMYERMQYYLERADITGEPLPNDLRGKILRDIKPQLDEAYDQFKQRNGRYQVKKGTPLDQNAKEKYYYISEGNVEKAKKMMREDGYDVP